MMALALQRQSVVAQWGAGPHIRHFVLEDLLVVGHSIFNTLSLSGVVFDIVR